MKKQKKKIRREIFSLNEKELSLIMRSLDEYRRLLSEREYTGERILVDSEKEFKLIDELEEKITRKF